MADNLDSDFIKDSADQTEIFVCMLKACAKEKDLHRGNKIHSNIVRSGLLKKNTFLGNSLVNMYAKCGALRKAQLVFDELPVQDVVSWNVLITGYAHQRNSAIPGLKSFQQMQLEGICPNAITFLGMLKAISSIGFLLKGQQIHAQILPNQLHEKDVVIANALIDMYAKCGRLVKAQELFDELLILDVISWNVLITGYAQYDAEKALSHFKRMQMGSFSPDAVTFTCILKACASMGARTLFKGKTVHSQVLRYGLLEKDVVIGNSLIDMYAKCGELRRAQEVFDKLQIRNVVSWNTLVSGYCQHGQYEKALDYFEHMKCDDFSPNEVTFLCALKACGNVGAAQKGEQIHSTIVREGFLETNKNLSSALLSMYAKCGLLAKAQEVFEELSDWDVVSWNTLIAGYAQNGHFDEALNYFAQMRLQGIALDAVTFVCVLKACGDKGADINGKEIHADIVRQGLLENNSILGNALLDMYAKCGLFEEAEEMFAKLPLRDVVTCNVLITGYVQHGHGEDALRCFQLMQTSGFSPDEVTFVCILKACGCLRLLNKGQEIHNEICRRGSFGEDFVVGTALVDMYSKCGELVRAHEVFNELPTRNVVSWSALIAGYVQLGNGEEALHCFEQMQMQGLTPDSVTLMCMLKACSSIGASVKGQEIHIDIIREGFLEENNAIGNSLVDMYVKCGMFEDAQDVFEELLVQDVVSWNALLSGYAQLGKDESAFSLFEKMIGDAKSPNLVTFTILVNACSRTGLLEMGQAYLEVMISIYKIIPDLDHYTCIIDLFGRAGHLDKAIVVIEEMPFSPSITVWHTMLGACHKWGDILLGRLAFEHAIHLDDQDAAPYICMINIYHVAGRLEDADKIEAMRLEKQAWNVVGGTVQEGFSLHSL